MKITDNVLLRAILLVFCIQFGYMFLFCLWPYIHYGSNLPGLYWKPNDPYADLIKYGLSIKELFTGFEDTENFSKLNDIYKTYWLNNPYKGIDGVITGAMHTHFLHPPFYFFISIFFTFVLTYTGSVDFTVILFYFSALAIFVMLMRFLRFSIKDSVLAILLYALCYPTVFAFIRGNISLFTSTIYCAVIIIFSINKKSWTGNILAALTIPLRLPSIIFLGILHKNNNISSWKFLIKHSLIILVLISITSATLFFIAGYIYPDFTFKNYLKASSNFVNIFCFTGGDGISLQNISILAFLGNIGVKNILLKKSLYIIISALFTFLSAVIIYKNIQNNVVKSFVLISLYCLVCPITVAYHLHIFLAPILLMRYYKVDTESCYNYRVILSVSAIMLSPFPPIIWWSYLFHIVLFSSIIILFVLSVKPLSQK
ncbi:MAG: hypothetical protein J5934_02450 [Succinivibrio sp.]|nr:hypothetical protein [Succinivibrio sp.]